MEPTTIFMYEFEGENLPDLLVEVADWIRENVHENRVLWDVDMHVIADGEKWWVSLYLGREADGS